MKQLEQAHKFLAKAAEDEALLDAALVKSEVSDSIFGFHAQQAADIASLKSAICNLKSSEAWRASHITRTRYRETEPEPPTLTPFAPARCITLNPQPLCPIQHSAFCL